MTACIHSRYRWPDTISDGGTNCLHSDEACQVCVACNAPTDPEKPAAGRVGPPEYREPATVGVLAEVCDERQRQDEKWGEQNHGPEIWMLVLGEEYGEAQKALLESRALAQACEPHISRRFLRECRAELIQVAAVAVNAVESLDRNELKDGL